MEVARAVVKAAGTATEAAAMATAEETEAAAMVATAAAEEATRRAWGTRLEPRVETPESRLACSTRCYKRCECARHWSASAGSTLPPSRTGATTHRYTEPRRVAAKRAARVAVAATEGAAAAALAKGEEEVEEVGAKVGVEKVERWGGAAAARGAAAVERVRPRSNN